MSIHQTPGGRWRVRYYESGQTNPRSRTFDTKREARDFEAAVRLAKRTNTQVRRASTQTLEHFGAEYRETYAKVELAPNTLKVQATLWNRHVLPRIGSVPLSTLAHNPELLQHFKADMKADGVGDGAVSKTLAVVSAVLGKAVEWNRIPTNPAATIRKPPAKRKRVVEPISPEQVERLRAHTMVLDYSSSARELVVSTDSLLIVLMAYAGLRPGETLALTWGDVGSQSISVTKAVALGEVGDTKTRRDRTVPLVAPLRNDLESLHELRSYGAVEGARDFPDDDRPIFERSGGPWKDHDWRNWRKRVWQPACAKIGLGQLTLEPRRYVGPRPYDLRHSAASLALAAGTSPLEVADMLGHGPQVLFSTYAHVIAELRGQAPASADERISAAREKVASERAECLSRLVSDQLASERHERRAA
jgi:integrase